MGDSFAAEWTLKPALCREEFPVTRRNDAPLQHGLNPRPCFWMQLYIRENGRAYQDLEARVFFSLYRFGRGFELRDLRLDGGFAFTQGFEFSDCRHV